MAKATKMTERGLEIERIDPQTGALEVWYERDNHCYCGQVFPSGKREINPEFWNVLARMIEEGSLPRLNEDGSHNEWCRCRECHPESHASAGAVDPPHDEPREEDSRNSRVRAKEWPYRRYKQYQRDLQVVAARWFQEQGMEVSSRYPYILAKPADWPRNMIEPDVATYVNLRRSERGPHDAFPLHKYVHHGLSSQAALFNLVVPMLLRNDLSPLRQALSASGVAWPDGEIQVELEHEDRNTFREDSGQPTSIDLMLRGEVGPPLLIESKLSEPGFGGCSVFACGDCDGRNPTANLADCYLHFIGRRYWSLLDKYGFLQGPMGGDATCTLASHYQYFRELLFALEHGGTFVLLYDDRNPTFYNVHPNDSGKIRGLMPLLEGLVPDQLKNRLARVSFRDVLAAADDQDMHRGWVASFRSKYGL